MLDHLLSAEKALEVAARDFDPSTCSGSDAVKIMERLGAQRRLIDGMLAKVAKRIEDTAEHTRHRDRSAAELCTRVTGVSTGEAKRAIEVAAKLESLPATDAAVRAGTLSARATDLIVSAASEHPEVEAELLRAAARGLVPLRDAVIAARARREDETARAQRQHAARSFRMWPTADGMVEGHFKVTPQVGGAIKAVIDKGTGKRFRDARSSGVHESQDAYAADAFADAVAGDAKASKGGGWSAHVMIDHEALVRGQTIDGETCEIPGVGPVSVAWVRQLLGTAFVTAIVRKGKDITTVAHFGRHIPAELRTAMIVSGRECSIEGCSGREYLELDHCEIDHAKNGPTAWFNLAWLCSIHHTRKTQGWILGPPNPKTGKRRLDQPPAARHAA
jgi:hypothetical protein